MRRVVRLVSRGWDVVVLAAAALSCKPSSQAQGSAPPYIVTEHPIDVGLDSLGICVGVDGRNPQGVWWWQSGTSGCESRMTGPGIFHAEDASVSRPTPGESLAVRFRMSTHSITRPFVVVRLVVKDGEMRAPDSGAEVAVQRRDALDIPERLPL
jgi:hypothetical protein